MSRPYHRGEINKAFEKIKAKLHSEAVLKGRGRAFYFDSYTGNELRGGDPYDYDHIFPSEMIHTLLKDDFTDEEIAEIVNLRENIAVTLRTINQSKGKKNPEIWVKEEALVNHGLIDLEKVNDAVFAAKSAINKKIKQMSGGSCAGI